jgi:hypothetical protein
MIASQRNQVKNMKQLKLIGGRSFSSGFPVKKAARDRRLRTAINGSNPFL